MDTTPTPPPPPPPGPAPSKVVIQTKHVAIAATAFILTVMVAGMVLMATAPKRTCIDASAQALAAIERGAERSVAPLHLTNGKAITVTLTYPNGNKVDGYLVAAPTEAVPGVGVWAMDADVFAGADGNIQAVDIAARMTANWGGDLPNPVSDGDISAAEACIAI